MIVFATAVTDDDTYDRHAVPGIERAAEADSVILAQRSAGSLFRNYNALLDKASRYAGLEALVLLHQDVELADDDFAEKVREALSDPDVAIVGCVGAVGVRGLGWWQGALTWASMTHRYPEYGGGEFPAISWRTEAAPSSVRPGEVDSIDGFVMVLSPWAVRELRFDESLGKFHGYDFDICMQARAAGKKVATAPFRAIHHHSLELIDDPETWIQTYIRLAEKWRGQLPETGSDPERRAVRAEAEAACARALMVSHQMREQAIKRRLDSTERELDETRDQLKAMRRDLDAARHKGGEGGKPATPRGAKVGAIDHAVDELGIESFASLEFGQACGQYAFYAIGKPGVREGALIDISGRRAGDYLLSALEHASEHPGMRILDGSFSSPDTVAEIGEVDAVLMFDVLLRMVDPGWDQVLERYAPATSRFVIANPQWERDETTIRLIELGRDGFVEAVPPWAPHLELFDRIEESDPGSGRPYRDAVDVWQWGITDADLKRKMEELGFALVREWSLNRHPQAQGFVNKAFVFGRSGAP